MTAATATETRAQRETMSAVQMVRPDGLGVGARHLMRADQTGEAERDQHIDRKLLLFDRVRGLRRHLSASPNTSVIV